MTTMSNNKEKDILKYVEHTINPYDARVAEHETMFAFNSTAGNDAFNVWWCVDGFLTYSKWVEEKLDKLKDMK